MEKNIRRGGRGVTQLDLDRMTLIGPDQKAVLTERKSLLVAAGDDILKLFERKFNPALMYYHSAPNDLLKTGLQRLMARCTKRSPKPSATPETLSYQACSSLATRSRSRAQYTFRKTPRARPRPFDKKTCRWL